MEGSEGSGKRFICELIFLYYSVTGTQQIQSEVAKSRNGELIILSEVTMITNNNNPKSRL